MVSAEKVLRRGRACGGGGGGGRWRHWEKPEFEGGEDGRGMKLKELE